jgi:hypothetical protein
LSLHVLLYSNVIAACPSRATPISAAAAVTAANKIRFIDVPQFGFSWLMQEYGQA